MFSLSGYFHIKTSVSYNSLIHCSQVEEWLDSHCYSLKMCPSQTEEMVPVGALCFSNLFMHREELKQSIMSHPLWEYADSEDPPVFDIDVSNFIASQKKTKLLFVSSEKSKQDQIINFFKKTL
jgi:hypothetical protein